MNPPPVGRLAFRVEGRTWSVYYARPDTMDGALFLGSIRMTFVEDDPEMKERFMSIFRDVMEKFFQAHGAKGVESWEEQEAPESERGGSA